MERVWIRRWAEAACASRRLRMRGFVHSSTSNRSYRSNDLKLIEDEERRKKKEKKKIAFLFFFFIFAPFSASSSFTTLLLSLLLFSAYTCFSCSPIACSSRVDPSPEHRSFPRRNFCETSKPFRRDSSKDSISQTVSS